MLDEAPPTFCQRNRPLVGRIFKTTAIYQEALLLADLPSQKSKIGIETWSSVIKTGGEHLFIGPKVDYAARDSQAMWQTTGGPN
jgi:hypothetical protein